MKKKKIRVAVLIFAAVSAYVLSAGPMWALTSHRVISKTAFGVIYVPLVPLEKHCPADLFWRYMNWWAPGIEL